MTQPINQRVEKEKEEQEVREKPSFSLAAERCRNLIKTNLLDM